MPTLPPEFAAIMIACQPLFSKRVFANAQLLLTGAILTPGRRTVTTALRVMGHTHDTRYHKYHRVLSQARWSARHAARILLTLLVESFAPEGPLVFGLDDTIERRWGAKIKARGIYRDPVRSSRGHFVKASGLRWLSLMLLCEVPLAKRVWALPALTVLCPSERSRKKQGLRHKTLLDWARQMLLQLRRWLPGRDVVVVARSSFSAIEFLAAVGQHVTFVTRLRLDAALYSPAPPRRVGQVGRPRKKGERLPSLEAVLEQAQTRWQAVVVSQWYGRTSCSLELATGTAVWYHAGLPVVPIRWVLVRDRQGQLAPKAFLSTTVEARPLEVVSWFVRRWQVEVTFAEVRRHLGVETQRQWSDLAIARTTPVLLGLFSLITLMGATTEETLCVGKAAWYGKEHATFSDVLAWVRRRIWRRWSYSLSEPQTETLEIPRRLFERLTSTLAYAA